METWPLDLREKLDDFRSVSRVPGEILEQNSVGPRCALFNPQTGLLSRPSGDHAQDPLTGGRIFFS